MPPIDHAREIRRLHFDDYSDEQSLHLTSADSELTVACYLGLSSRADLRELRLTTPVLKWFLICESLGGIIRNPYDVLELLHDETMYRVPIFPDNETTIGAAYPLENVDKLTSVSNKRWRLAAVLFNLHKELQDWSAGTGAEIDVYHDLWKKRFETYIEDKHRSAGTTGLIAPDVDITEIQLPILGPRQEFGEFRTEPFNRCLILLKSLGQLTARYKWIESFNAKSAPTHFQDTKSIDLRFMPGFMRPPPAPEVLVDDPRRTYILFIDGWKEDELKELFRSQQIEFDQPKELPPLQSRYRVIAPTAMPSIWSWILTLQKVLELPRRHLDIARMGFEGIQPPSDWGENTLYETYEAPGLIPLEKESFEADMQYLKATETHLTLYLEALNLDKDNEEHLIWSTDDLGSAFDLSNFAFAMEDDTAAKEQKE